MAVASGLVCTFINPVKQITDWSTPQSIGTGLAFGIALAVCEALWGSRFRYLAVLVPAATLIAWIAAWWSTLWVGAWADDFFKWAFGNGAGELPSQIAAGMAGGAVGAALTAVSLSALRKRSRLAWTIAIGAALGMALVLELEYDLRVLYVLWQAGFAFYFGHCLAKDRKKGAAG